MGQELLDQNIYHAGAQAEQDKQRSRRRSLETQATGTQQTEQQVPEVMATGENWERSNGSKNDEMEQYIKKYCKTPERKGYKGKTQRKQPNERLRVRTANNTTADKKIDMEINPTNNDNRAETAEKQIRKRGGKRMGKTQQRRISRNMTLNNAHKEINAEE